MTATLKTFFTRPVCKLAVLLAFHPLASSALGQNWNGSTGNWNTAANWGGSVPTSTSDPTIPSGTVNVTTGVSGVYDGIWVGGTPGLTAYLNISGGSLSGNDVAIGQFEDVTGYVNVTGGTWTTANAMNVGSLGGNGYLVIDGGAVTSYGGNIGSGEPGIGEVTVTSGSWNMGAGSLTVKHGANDRGLLINGGAVSNETATLGGSGGTGNVTMTSGSWNSGYTYVGYFGAGSATISGGTATVEILYAGYADGGVGNVTVSDTGILNVDSAIFVGFFNDSAANLTISAGGTVTSSGAEIGYGEDTVMNIGHNTVTITGEGSSWRANSLALGSYDNTVTMEDGGLLSVDLASIDFGTGMGNFLRLDEGYLAIYGESADFGSLLDAGRILVWDNLIWKVATEDDVTLTYYTDDVSGEVAGFADTGHNNLGGYTVMTTNAVPEPTVTALLCLGLSSLILSRRRK